MKNSFLRILVSFVFVAIFHVSIVTTVQAQAPPPPPPPARDYFPQVWDEYTFQGGKFRIRFPKQPSEAVNSEGRFAIHTIEYNGVILYQVSYVDFKVPIDDPRETRGRLEGVKAAMLNTYPAKDIRLITARDMVVDGHQGIFVHMEVRSNMVIRMQWVAAGSRLYSISASSRKGSPMELEGKDDFNKLAIGFIDSFHVVP